MTDEAIPVSDDQVTELLRQYDADLRLHEGLAEELERTLKQLIDSNSLGIHSVTARVKEREKFEQKLRHRQTPYAALCEVTDVVGLRIITHYPDEVDAVAEVVKAEFDIDDANSTDKRALLNPDQFGYMSLHYAAKLPERRLHTELERYRKCVFEVQIRSILQHAWAEIEHDLGYKSEAAIPRHIRRRFSRLAGLLELADDEFKAIRDELASYGETVEEEVRRDPTSVYIDQTSLDAFERSSDQVASLDRRIADATGCELLPWSENTSETSSYRTTAVTEAGFATISELAQWLDRYGDFVVAFGAALNAAFSAVGRGYAPGVSVLFLSHVRASLGGLDSVRRYLQARQAHIEGQVEAVAERFFDAFEKAKESVPLPAPPPG